MICFVWRGRRDLRAVPHRLEPGFEAARTGSAPPGPLCPHGEGCSELACALYTSQPLLVTMASQDAAEQAAGSTDPLQYDLTTVVAKSLDRHLVFPLLEFLSQKQLYPAEDIESAKLELIEKTNMVDYAVDIYQGLNQTDEVSVQGVGETLRLSFHAAGNADARRTMLREGWLAASRP